MNEKYSIDNVWIFYILMAGSAGLIIGNYIPQFNHLWIYDSTVGITTGAFAGVVFAFVLILYVLLIRINQLRNELWDYRKDDKEADNHE